MMNHCIKFTLDQYYIKKVRHAWLRETAALPEVAQLSEFLNASLDRQS